MLSSGAASDAGLLSAAATGFALSGGLILAIGAQNAFVLRQGLRREHVGLIVLTCAGLDALLMTAGIAGLAGLLAGRPALALLLTWGGAAFLGAYAVQALRRAWRPSSLQADAGAASARLSRRAAWLQCLAFTLLNPHVYLDTVVLVGSVGAQHPGAARWAFAAGAAAASAAWFSALGYGARWLAPVFARPRAWQVLDGLIGLTMAALAVALLWQGRAGR